MRQPLSEVFESPCGCFLDLNFGLKRVFTKPISVLIVTDVLLYQTHALVCFMNHYESDVIIKWSKKKYISGRIDTKIWSHCITNWTNLIFRIKAIGKSSNWRWNWGRLRHSSSSLSFRSFSLKRFYPNVSNVLLTWGFLFPINLHLLWFSFLVPWKIKRAFWENLKLEKNERISLPKFFFRFFWGRKIPSEFYHVWQLWAFVISF